MLQDKEVGLLRFLHHQMDIQMIQKKSKQMSCKLRALYRTLKSG